MTKKYTCIIQEGQAAEREKATLEAELRAIGVERFGDDPSDTEVDWVVMKKGWAWTAGEPSTSSLIIRSVPVDYPSDEREAFLRSVGDLWSNRTGCHINEVVITAWDGPLPG